MKENHYASNCVGAGDVHSENVTDARCMYPTDAEAAGKTTFMSTWSKDELQKIAEADDLHIAPFRADGVTYGTPTWIWSVVVDDALYVRAYNGLNSRWYQAAMWQKTGRITAAGITKEVTFEPITDTALNQQIDNAYRAKYHASPYLAPMIGARARAASVKVLPRDTNA